MIFLKLWRLSALSFVFSVIFPVFCFSENNKELTTWTHIVEQMEVHLNRAYQLYTQGKNKEAYDAVNVAYFRFYESKGMEKITMGYLSGARKTAVENAFYQYRRNVKSDKSAEEVRQHKDALIEMLYKDAAELDGTSGSSKSSGSIVVFISSFILVLREGLEAILIIAAIIAYLVKTGKKRYANDVYLGSIAGIIFSIILAVLFKMIAGAQSGVAQEAFEGIGMFVAVAVLFYVSNWMVSKSEVEVWERYIKEKVEASVSSGNRWLLAFTAFIAVAREGAELILFFQGIDINGTDGRIAVTAAIILAAIILSILFFMIRFLTVKLPLKPFFIVTSVIMYVLCFSFTGKGVGELQAAGFIGKTEIGWMGKFSFDLLGIYPTYESIVPQIVILFITLFSALFYIQKNKKQAKKFLSKER